MVGVMMVAEKPSIGGAIAHALSRGDSNMETRGKPPVHEFEGEFLGMRAAIKVTSVAGHIFSTDFPTAYQSWDAVDPVELFTVDVVKVAEKKAIVAHLAREAKGIDYLVLWLDCDREGENICFEVIECVRESLKPVRGQQIFRAKFSAITPKDIHAAMRTLGEPNENESLAVEARQELDLKVGVAFSRFQTRYFQGKYGDLDSSLISYGPCQTPTLGFCVDRHDEIQSFTPESFWALQARIRKGASEVDLEWERGRVFDQDVAITFHRLMEESPIVIVSSIKESETKKPRPNPLNTVELLKLGSKTLGLGPHQTMRVSENLYLSGYLSYPRTESTSYPESFDIREALNEQSGDPNWGSYVRNLLHEGFVRPKEGVDMGDHPPITPVRALPAGLDVTPDMHRVYDLVTRHFIATVSPDAVFFSTKVIFSSPCGEMFTANGRRMIRPGFLEILRSSSEEQSLPSFMEGETLSLCTLRVRDGHTSPPGYLTESELIGMMEKHGIGTDASIATHIHNVCERNYVSIAAGRTLVPTSLGIVLVHGYYRIDPDLVLPNVRAAIERDCTLIAQGRAAKADVVQHSIRCFELKYRYFVQRIEAMDSLFEATFSPLAATGKFLSKCGKCLRFMRYIHLKPQRLYCPTCNTTYRLPQNGTIKLYMEVKCPLDNFQLVLFSLGNAANAQGKAYTLCPYCYNYPPDFESISNADPSTMVDGEPSERKNAEAKTKDDTSSVPQVNMGCNQCLHPTCKFSESRLGVCPCPMTPEVAQQIRHGRGQPQSGPEDGCEGTLVLDVTSKPHWKLACNVCNALIRIHGDVVNLNTVDGECEECSAALLQFQFKESKSPLANGELTREGCIICDDELNALTELIMGRRVHVKLARAKRGVRGRSRGRGRGRRRQKGDVKMSFEDF